MSSLHVAKSVTTIMTAFKQHIKPATRMRKLVESRPFHLPAAQFAGADKEGTVDGVHSANLYSITGTARRLQ